MYQMRPATGYGKVKLVLRRGRYYMESEVRDLLRLLVSTCTGIVTVSHLLPGQVCCRVHFS